MSRQLSNQAAVAKIIRSALKAHGIPGHVRSREASMMTAVDVTLHNPTPWTIQAVERATGQYEYGHFDGMIDCYEFDNKRDDIPQVKFLHVHAEYSEDVRQTAWEWLTTAFSGFEGAPAHHGDAHTFHHKGMGEYGNTLLWRVLSGAIEGFWQKPRRAA